MRTLLAAAFLLVVPTLLFGDGRPMPPEPPHDRPGVQLRNFSVRRHHVDIVIRNQVARVSVDQTFHNPNPFPLRAVYIFPIPGYAAVDKLSLKVDGRDLEAELLEKDKARRFFQQAVRKHREAALLEHLGQDVFRADIGVIPAGGDRRVEIAYSHPVPKDNGLFRFGYPLRIERFSSEPIESCRIAVTLEADAPLLNVYSPTHEISIEKATPQRFRVVYEASNVLPERDFLLYYASDRKDLGLNLLTYREPGRDGFFMAFLSPRHGLEIEPLPKDVIFVIDTSGSMQGEKIQQARAALRHCVDALNEGDRFNVLAFSSGLTPLFAGLESAKGPNRVRARNFIDQIRAGGGTNIHDALLEALKQFPAGAGRPGYIVFLTDGIPTLGPVTDGKGIARAVREKNPGVRLFNFGLGYDVNSVLLNQLALENRGLAEYVAPGENIEDRVSAFYAKVSDPILTDPRLAAEGIEIEQVYPRPVPDIFRGSQVIVYGRFRGKGEADLILSGRFRGEEKKFTYRASFAASDTTHEFIPRFWARTKIGFLLDQMRIHGESEELRKEIVRLSREYGIITPYTSWMVVDELNRTNRRAAEGFRDAGAPAAPSAPLRRVQTGQAPSGGGAFRAAKAFSRMQRGKGSEEREDKALEPNLRRAIRRVGTKTFVQSKGVWIDTAFQDGMKTTKVRFDSDEYWELLKEKPSLARYQSIGFAMIVVLDGRAYEILTK